MKFELIKKDSTTKARLGRIKTLHGEIETPVFMPVGTQGSVKALDSDDIYSVGAKIILGNTYYLYLKPGTDIIQKAGGLHKFSNISLPILTDSGGYQVFSLSDMRKLTADGVLFDSKFDGSKHLFTPEKVIEIQETLGSDIAMVLDECPPYPCEEGYMEESVKVTLEWAKRALNSKKLSEEKQSIFGIVQGGLFPEIRKYCLEALVKLDFPGYALGGLSVGEPADKMHEIISLMGGLMPENKPRYLMGLGTPEDIVLAVEEGIDMFDCVMPTRNARNGTLFTFSGKMAIKNAEFKNDFSPIEEGCDCLACRKYSRAYLNHLFRVKELSVLRLNSIHNLRFMMRLMERIREAIRTDSFAGFKTEFFRNYVTLRQIV